MLMQLLKRDQADTKGRLAINVERTSKHTTTAKLASGLRSYCGSDL